MKDEYYKTLIENKNWNLKYPPILKWMSLVVNGCHCTSLTIYLEDFDYGNSEDVHLRNYSTNTICKPWE